MIYEAPEVKAMMAVSAVAASTEEEEEIPALIINCI